MITDGLRENFDLDLADMSRVARVNNGVHFLVILVDMFSRQAFVEPIKNKSGAVVTNAMQTLFNRMPSVPKTIRHDAGREFLNAHFAALMDKHGIETFTTAAQHKANYAERFIRTLKTRIHRFMTGQSTQRYIDVLQSIVDAYNGSFHSSIGMKPNDVTQRNESELWKKLYLETNRASKLKPFRYAVGSKVRIMSKKGPLEKGYTENWSRTVYIVQTQRRRGGLAMYELSDLMGVEVSGLFYERELQQVVIEDEKRIEYVRNTRIRNKTREYLVRWAHYGPSYDEWIPEETYQKHQQNVSR